MPIDYSKFDNIDDSDGEDEPRPGGGQDFERLMQECLRKAAEKEATDPQDLLFPASGNGAPWRGTPPPPPMAPPPPAVGWDPLDPYDPWDGGYGLDGLDDDMGMSRSVDMDAIRAEAWRLLCGRLVAVPGPAESVPRQLLLEAEVHMMASRYRPALVAAVAVQLATAAPEGAGAAQGAYGPWTAPTLAVEMVCSYQLGDRDRAVALRELVQRMDRSSLSQHLLKRFEGTAEVLEFLPQFLSLLQEQERKGDGVAG